MSSFAAWQVSRRSEVAEWLLGIAFAVLVLTFFKAQVLDHERYKLQSADNRLRGVTIEAPRGDILDRNGDVIADNFSGYSIKLIASREDTLRAVLGRLNALLHSDTLDVEALVRVWRGARYQPVVVSNSGKWSMVAVLDEHRSDLPGLVIQREPRRRYLDSSAVAHLVGYVGEVSPEQLQAGTFAGATMGEIVGKQGLERTYDSILRGREGVHYVEVTAGGRTVREQPMTGTISPLSGTAIHTTLDMGLQRFIDSMWSADQPNARGAIVAMTPKGEILAYYSRPGFNPNAFVGGVDAATYSALNASDAHNPLLSRVIQGQYPPASPFKLAIAAMALRRGLVTMDSKMKMPCTGSFTYGGRTWKCWNHTGAHGYLTLRDAIATSCDVYFYQLGLLLGAQALFEDGVDMGFTERTGIDLENENRSNFPLGLKSYINSRGVQTWGNGEVLNLAIGQGRNTQTLINMVSFYAALAGDGIKREPYLVKPPTNPVLHDLRLTPEQLAGLREAMLKVVNSGTATAGLASEAGIKQYGIAGKTGSGQVTGQKDIGWFIAFAPVDAPKIVIGIQVEEAIHGGLIAKYAVRAIVKYLTGKSIRVEVADSTEDLSGDSTAVDSTRHKKPPVKHP